MKWMAVPAVLALAVSASALAAARDGAEHVSQSALNGNGPFHASFAGVAADGSHVFFQTDEVLAATDADSMIDVYERAGGQTRQVSLGDGPFTASFITASADGSRVVFRTQEPLVAADTDTAFDLYLRFEGTTSLVSGGLANEDADFLAATADGSHVFFRTREGLLASDDDVDRYDIYDRAGGALVHANGARRPGIFPEDALFRGISEDGTHLFYDTFEDVLASDNEPGGSAIDLYDRIGNSTIHVTEGSNVLTGAGYAGASADGSRVFFHTSESRSSATDTDASQDIYERSTAGVSHVSQGVVIANGPRAAVFADASADGSRVLFTSSARLAAGDLDAAQDIYEASGGETRLVSAGTAPVPVFFQAASTDGSRVFFATTEQLAATDTDAAIDLYLASGGQTTQVSLGNGAPHSTFRAASADGTRVFFDTTQALVASDTDSVLDLYEWANGEISQVSQGNGAFNAGFGGLTPDGARVLFQTGEALTGTDTDAVADVYASGLTASTPTPTPTATPEPPAAMPVAQPAATATPAPARKPPTLVGSRTLRVKRGALSLTLQCGAVPCRGSARIAAKRARLKFNSAQYRIDAGKRARVTIRLSAASRRAVARGRLRVTLRLAETGGPSTRISLTLRR